MPPKKKVNTNTDSNKKIEIQEKKTVGEIVQEKDKISKIEYNAMMKKSEHLESQVEEYKSLLTDSEGRLDEALNKVDSLELLLNEKTEKINNFKEELKNNQKTYKFVKIDVVLKRLGEIFE